VRPDAGLDGDQDLAGGVVGDVPGVPADADADGGHDLTCGGVQNGFGAAGFVGDPDPVTVSPSSWPGRVDPT
jgi:hypothetical protein